VSYDSFSKDEHIPAGRLNTPAPTIPLTRLKISLEIVAVPPPEDPGAGDSSSCGFIEA
jgi:hypothetical protein